MRVDRRNFLAGATIAGAAAAGGCAEKREAAGSAAPGPSQEAIDRAASAPVLKLDGLSSPVVIDSIRLLRRTKTTWSTSAPKTAPKVVSVTNPPRADYLAPSSRAW